MTGSTCEHWRGLPKEVRPRTDKGCEECLQLGMRWVNLRLCRSCGHVGCCDTSEGRHATAHHAVTGHPIIRAMLPGESWSWCFVDQEFVEPAKL